jgi:CubicO group peptidase (beta-lactamase class C family)
MGIGVPHTGLPDWMLPRPGEAGIAPRIVDELHRAVVAGRFSGLHSVLVLRNGILACEQHFAGPDEDWGQPLGTIAHGPALAHDLRSITKSVVSLLYGVALSAGLVPPPAAKLVDAFPDYAHLFADPLKRRITVGHALSMRMGLAWKEDLAYSDPRNGERLMEQAQDRIAHVLGLPIEHRSGTKWVYCGGATVLLAALIERGTGLPLDAYARQVLFVPLGIAGETWARWADGTAAASSGLRLTARDTARIGQMVLEKGLWHGRRIVPAGWLATSMKPRAFAEPGLRYGYQWWIGQLAANGKPWQAAYGNGGQRLIIVPSLKLVVVLFAGNYNTADQWKMPVRLMSQIILPAVL